MTSLTDTQVITASGGLVELGYLATSATTTSVTATSFPSSQSYIGPLSVVTDGSPVTVEFFCTEVKPPTVAGGYVEFSLFVDGVERTRYWGTVMNETGTTSGNKPVFLSRRLAGLSAGTHTFEVRLFANSTTGTPAVYSNADASTGVASPAFLRVSKIVQATQWPAVTTGTILCTSSTRPASPFEGQTIWEGDTDRTYVWNGSAWVAPQVQSKPPSAQIKGGASAFTTNEGTDIHCVWMTTISWDTDSMTGTSNRITINKSGLYLVNGSLTTPAGNSSDYRVAVKVAQYNSGGTLIDSLSQGGSHITIGWGKDPCVAGVLNCSAGDYLQLRLDIDSSTNNTNMAISYPRLQATLIGNT